MDDNELMNLMKKDPDTAMNYLIDHYGGLVYAVVQHKLSGGLCLSTDAEDCVADTFSEFYMARRRFDLKKASVKTYLCVIARHNAADLLRKRGRRRNDVSADGDDIRLADDVCLVADLEEKQMRQAVLSAVEELGEPDRSILLGKYYFGRSSAVIARDLGLSVSNVDSRTSRAVGKLRCLFGGNEP